MTPRAKAPPTVSASLRLGRALGLLLAFAPLGCVEAVEDDELEPRAAERRTPTPDEDDEPDVLDASRDAHDDCTGVEAAPLVTVVLPLAPGRDLVLPRGGAELRLLLRGTGTAPLEVEPLLTWRFAGGVEREAAARVELRPGVEHELVLALPDHLDTSAHPASLDVQLRPWQGSARGIDVVVPAVFFHVDPASGDTHVYDAEGMVARHRAGDLLGTHRAVDERDDVAGVGVAHLATPEELGTDPAEQRRRLHQRPTDLSASHDPHPQGAHR